MEDISRELEREIARTKPTPYNRPKGKNILIVSDFGELKSGNYLKAAVYFLLIASVVASLGAAGFYWLYSQTKQQKISLETSVSNLEEKVQRLTSEKELLMARLVVTGNVSELETMPDVQSKLPQKEKRQGMIDKPDQGPLADASGDVTEPGGKLPSEPISPNASQGPAGQSAQDEKEWTEPLSDQAGSVTVDNFSLSHGSSRQQVVIRFDLKNTTKNSREISGRIFCVLRPENADSSQWVVTPKASLKDGIPGPYRKGHYFSISRFKPVQFTISTGIPLEKFTTATIYIFDETEMLLFKTTFKPGITEQG